MRSRARPPRPLQQQPPTWTRHPSGARPPTPPRPPSPSPTRERPTAGRPRTRRTRPRPLRCPGCAAIVQAPPPPSASPRRPRPPPGDSPIPPRGGSAPWCESPSRQECPSCVAGRRAARRRADHRQDPAPWRRERPPTPGADRSHPASSAPSAALSLDERAGCRRPPYGTSVGPTHPSPGVLTDPRTSTSRPSTGIARVGRPIDRHERARADRSDDPAARARAEATGCVVGQDLDHPGLAPARSN